MFNKNLTGGPKGREDRIRWRSHEVARIEALSDAVFAFALSLLVISLEVPKNSHELIELLHGLLPFGISCIIIFWLWRTQYKFFRRYGLHDNVTLYLNAVLMFAVLAFVYPLKFLFSAIFLHSIVIETVGDYFILTLLYNVGFVVFSLIFVLLYANAASRRDEISLTPIEHFQTVSHAIYFAIPGVGAAIACIIAILMRNGDPNALSACYFGYAAIGILMPVVSGRRKKAYHRLFGNKPVHEPHHGTEG